MLLWLLLLDTLQTYWLVLIPCIFIGMLRKRCGRLWIVFAFLILIAACVISETLAVVEDKDAIFMIGAMIRFVLSAMLLSLSLFLAARLRTIFGQRDGTMEEMDVSS